MKYEIRQTIDGEWQTPPRRKFYRSCCDCGLVHREEYRVHNGRIQYRVWRDREETNREREQIGKPWGRLVQIEAAARAWRRSMEGDDWTIDAIENGVCRDGMADLLRLVR